MPRRRTPEQRAARQAAWRFWIGRHVERDGRWIHTTADPVRVRRSDGSTAIITRLPRTLRALGTLSTQYGVVAVQALDDDTWHSLADVEVAAKEEARRNRVYQHFA